MGFKLDDIEVVEERPFANHDFGCPSATHSMKDLYLKV